MKAISFCGELTSKCSFKFCGITSGALTRIGRKLMPHGPNVRSPGPSLCRRSTRDRIGRIISSGEPLVIEESNPAVETPLKRWFPRGLTVPFQSGFFYAGNTSVFRRSTVFRKRFLGNQAAFINNSCIRLPILIFERRAKWIDGFRGSFEVVNTKQQIKKDCVSFIPLPTYFHITLNWDSKDDLDLIVYEPDGTRLNKNNMHSPNTCGRLGRDKVYDACFSRNKTSGMEVVYYRACQPPTGTFTIKAEHHTNCNNMPINWELIIERNGEMVEVSNGTSNAYLSAEIFTKKFVIT